MNQEKIGKFIATLRNEKGLTQSELAEKLNVTKNAVSKWERGLNLMDLALMKDLCEILDTNIAELLNGERIAKDDLAHEYETIIYNQLGIFDLNEKRLTKQANFYGALITIIGMIIIWISDQILVIILSIVLWLIATALNAAFYLMAKTAGKVKKDANKLKKHKSAH